MNISEALGWMKTLKARHAELVNLRNSNAATTHQRYGDNTTTTVPTYNALLLDRRVTLLAREMRQLDEAIKRTNAATEVANFTRNENVLGELET